MYVIVEGIFGKLVIMDKVSCPFVFNMYYFCGENGKEKYVWDKEAYPIDEGTPVFKDFHISNVTVTKASACAGFIYGLKEMPIKNVSFSNVSIEMDPKGEPAYPAMMDGIEKMVRELIQTYRGIWEEKNKMLSELYVNSSKIAIYGTGDFAQIVLDSLEMALGYFSADIVYLDTFVKTGERQFREKGVFNYQDVNLEKFNMILILSELYDAEIRENISSVCNLEKVVSLIQYIS